MLTIWLFDLQRIIPPAPLHVARGVACRAVQKKNPSPPADIFWSAQNLNRFIAAIQAPRGLHDEIEHCWFHDGEMINTVKLSGISGGRKDGYRTWSVKRNFHQKPWGDWRCEARTSGGQLIGELRFSLEKES